MDSPDGAVDLFEKLKLTALLLIPLGILIALIFHFKNKATEDNRANEIDLASLKEDMLELANAKKAQRIESVENEDKPKLDSDEVRAEIESKREDFEEYELVSPLTDLEDVESEIPDSDTNEEENVQD